jgi:hypothetical protein
LDKAILGEKIIELVTEEGIIKHKNNNLKKNKKLK